jgi:hypothetical protein
MTVLPAALAQKLLQHDIANLVRRVQQGQPLTPPERSMLQDMAAAPAPIPSSPALVGSFVELAALLGVTRRTIQTWRKRSDAPRPTAAGFHEVEAWREFMRQAKLGGQCNPEEAELRLRRLLAETQEREMRLQARRALYVSRAEVRAEWGRVKARVTRLLREKFEQELPGVLVELEAAEIQSVNQRAIDEVLTRLSQGEA